MSKPLPLIVDLDGTLIKGDLTLELCLLHLRHRGVLGLIQLALWFWRGKARAKGRLAALHGDKIALAHLPFTDLATHRVYQEATTRALISGSPHALVTQIAEHHGGFALAKGTQGTTNLTGGAKAAYLRATYPEGFAYVGDSVQDIPVWQAADEAYAANVPAHVLTKARAAGVRPEVLSHRAGAQSAYLRALRAHQWAKNTLVWLVPFLSMADFALAWLWLALAGFAAFSLIASATYVFNDLMDIQLDRPHRSKHGRPLASGALSIPQGAWLMAGLAGAGFALAALLGGTFFAMAAGYAALSLLYSIVLKRLALVDTLVLSLLYCWRVMAGAVLFGLAINAWFMISLGFFFLGLALGKRAIELLSASATGAPIRGRGYLAGDAPLVVGAGLAANFLSIGFILIYALLERSFLLQTPQVAIAMGALLTLWVLRFWLLVHRGHIQDDPVIFAVKDRASLSIFALIFTLIVGEVALRPGGG